MADLKLYDVFDMSPLRDYIREHGECRVYCKGECFCRIGENAPDIGVVNSGGFAFALLLLPTNLWARISR